MFKCLKSYIAPIIISLLQWIATLVFNVDKKFFTYNQVTHYYIIVKCLYGILLIVFWCYLFHFIRKLKSRDAEHKRALKVFLVYVAIMLIYGIILWPGTWSWDDLMTLHTIDTYESFFPWQGIITGVYQDLLLQVLPFPGGIIILQNIIISMCVSAIVLSIERIFKVVVSGNWVIDTIVKLLPFFILPPVIMYQFSGYRMGIYVYLELFVLVKLIEINTEHYRWSWGNIILLAAVCVIVAIWRTESLIYIPFVILLLLISRQQPAVIRKKIVCIVLICLGSFGLNSWQKTELVNSNYEIISLLCPSAELVRAADINDDAELLNTIDKVTDIKVILTNPQYDGERLYWRTNCVRDGYSKEEYRNYIKAIVKLSLKYPKVVSVERLNKFIIATNLNGRTVYNDDSAYIFDEDCDNEQQLEAYTKNWFAYRPILYKTRTIVINILSSKTIDGERIQSVCRVVWNGLIPILIIIYTWIKLFVKKKWYYWVLCSSMVFKILIVFLTEPAGWLMYFLSAYLVGYLIFIYGLIWLIRTYQTEKTAN
ncbi:hypothetical protein [Pseudobutyrivibrio sp. MD2005]|uniref:hypothetical protein n=1 Tax=Pseudobutyrivibrio sp. MD2005 TaxID=1410616 RepID=UPI000483DA64|nr:hypothetical protein [Pseudobutyrivibrio sp. MD2005]